MNPYSIEGNYTEGIYDTFNQLFFRAPLGTMLDNNGSGTQTRISIHPSITQYPVTQSFGSAGSNYTLNGTYIFQPNIEVLYQNQFVAGIQNAVSEKIRIVDMVLPSGSTLSPYISIQQTSPEYENFTKDINYTEVAYSPQDEINDESVTNFKSVHKRINAAFRKINNLEKSSEDSENITPVKKKLFFCDKECEKKYNEQKHSNQKNNDNDNNDNKYKKSNKIRPFNPTTNHTTNPPFTNFLTQLLETVINDIPEQNKQTNDILDSDDEINMEIGRAHV